MDALWGASVDVGRGKVGPDPTEHLCGYLATALVGTMGSSVIIHGVWEARLQTLWAQGAKRNTAMSWTCQRGDGRHGCLELKRGVTPQLMWP